MWFTLELAASKKVPANKLLWDMLTETCEYGWLIAICREWVGILTILIKVWVFSFVCMFVRFFKIL